ncbi:MAG TPA: hypothetical protein VF306_08115 [Pirellulales bacterium]
MLIFARHALAACLLGDTTTFAGSPGPCGRLHGDSTNRAQGPGLPAEEPVLLLEGSWPDAETRPNRWSLDDAIDARFAWIDRWAAKQAERLAQRTPDCYSDNHPTLAYLNELALRYFLVKLLRVVAFFDEVYRPAPDETWQLYLADETDAVYAELFGALAERHGVEIAVHWQKPGRHGICRGADSTLRKFSWRRWAGRAASLISSRRYSSNDHHPRVILCGNPRVLDPVCAELLARGCRVWWLYEQFAVRAWWKWRRAGLAQLLCDDTRTIASRASRLPRPVGWAARSQSHRWAALKLAALGCPRRWDSLRSAHPTPEANVCRGVQLGRAIACWLSEQAAAQGVRQAGWLQQIDEHFEAVQPTSLVVDEDATPFKRVAVAMARRHGVGSLVVQHGAPCGPFGFAPLAADEICVWGESTRQQLLDWGVDDARIHVTGWPRDALSAHHAKSPSAKSRATRMRSSRNATEGVPYRRRWRVDWHTTERHRGRSLQNQNLSPRFLLLATVPPDDERPDTVTFHLTCRNHAAMLEMACAAVSQFAGARLTIKLHPRTPDAGVFESVADRWPQLDIRLVHNRDAASLFAEADCVLSCASTAGIEAALAGAPVVQLLPEGSGDVLSAGRWGLIGSARMLKELLPLIDQALTRGWIAAPEQWPDIVAETGPQAAAAIVEHVLQCAAVPLAGSEACGCPDADRSAVATMNYADLFLPRLGE